MKNSDLYEVINKIKHVNNIKADTEKKIHAPFSTSYIKNKTIYSMTFINIPEMAWPVEKATIIAKGKLPTKEKKPPWHDAHTNPKTNISTPVIKLFAKEFTPKNIQNPGIANKKIIERIIPTINWLFRGNKSFFHNNMNWRIIFGVLFKNPKETKGLRSVTYLTKNTNSDRIAFHANK